MHPFAAFLLSFAFFLAFNGSLPITDPVESNYALTAKEMLQSGDWISPQIYGHYWYDKPAMIYWLIAASYKVFGVGEFAARLPAAVFSAAGVSFGCYLANRLYGSRLAGILTAMVLATSLEYWALGRMVITDSVLFFFNSVALGALYLGTGGHGRGWFWLSYAMAGFAVLTKGPVGIVLPALIVFAYIVATKRWRLLGKLHLGSGIIVFGFVTLPWYLAMIHLHGQEFVDTFLGLHNYLRATVSEHPKDNVFYYYLVLFPVSLLPWSGLLFRSAVSAGRRAAHYPFLMTWLLVTVVFYTLMATKYPTYVFPALFPAALLIGRELETMRHASVKAWFWLTGPTLLLLGAVAFGVRLLPPADWTGLLAVVALSAVVLLWLQWRRAGLPLTIVVGLCVVAVSLLLVSKGLVPLAEDRSAKAIVRDLPAGAQVAAIGDYPTSAVFYSGLQIPRLVEKAAAPGGVWAGKYTMPTETVADFAARTQNQSAVYFIASGDQLPPLPDYQPVSRLGDLTLYKRMP